MNRVERIREKLMQAFQPTQLNVIDEGPAHIGHLGAQGGAGHYAVEIEAPQLKEKKMIEAHRMIYAALDDMMHTEIHALRIKIL